jgi:hydrogenase maturation protease
MALTVSPWRRELKRLPQAAIEKKVLFGLGNRYMRDDGIGLIVAAEAEKMRLPGVKIITLTSLELDEFLKAHGASSVVVVDAVQTGAPPGTITIHVVTPRETRLASLPGLHSLQLHDVLDLAQEAGLITAPVVVVGIESSDCSPGEGLSEEVRASIPRALEAVIRELRLKGPGR